jgi:hypothetical protein
MEAKYFSKSLVDSQHGVISQKTELFVNAAVGTSNPRCNILKQNSLIFNFKILSFRVPTYGQNISQSDRNGEDDGHIFTTSGYECANATCILFLSADQVLTGSVV